MEGPGGGRFTDTDWWAQRLGRGEWGQSFGLQDERGLRMASVRVTPFERTSCRAELGT